MGFQVRPNSALRGLLLGGVALAALAATAPAARADGAADEISEVVVFGRGETRQVQSIGQTEIAASLPGVSPLKAIAKLPGVNFQSADPFGAYEWSTSLSVRAFSQSQLGFTLDDVPLGDMSYANFNGLHISRAISSENIGRVELAQGAGALDTASSSNLGGTIKFTSIALSEMPGALVETALGTDATYRGFARLETGQLASGFRGYLSAAYQHADKWKGDGEQKQYQFNGKFEQPVGEHGKIGGFLNYSDRRENDYQDLSKQLIAKHGYNLDNISNNWPLALAIATAYNNGTAIPAPYQTVDDVYYNAAGLRKDWLGGLNASIETDALKIKGTAYFHHNEGQGLWFTPYVVTPGGAPMTIRTTEYEIDRKGLVSQASYELGQHTIEGGVWYESNRFDNARRFYGLDITGQNRDSLEFQKDPLATQWDYHYAIRTTQFHLQDTWKLAEGLKLAGGFKYLEVQIDSTTTSGTPRIDGRITARDKFLPQAGVNWQVGPGELFGSYSENMRAFNLQPFSTTQVGFDAIKGKLKPEKSNTYEGGYRLHLAQFDGVIAGYYVEFKNRLVSTTVGSGIQGNPSALSNAGSVTSKGVEATGTWRFLPNWALFGSYAYNDAKYDDDLRNGDNIVVSKTAGMRVVNAPKHIANLELGYDNGTVWGKVNAGYQSSRYYTLLNDASVSGRTVFDLGFGYRAQGAGWWDGLEIQANITNLFDKKYIATVGSNGFVDSDPTGAFQTLLAGAPRQAFVTVKKRF